MQYHNESNDQATAQTVTRRVLRASRTLCLVLHILLSILQLLSSNICVLCSCRAKNRGAANNRMNWLMVTPTNFACCVKKECRTHYLVGALPCYPPITLILIVAQHALSGPIILLEPNRVAAQASLALALLVITMSWMHVWAWQSTQRCILHFGVQGGQRDKTRKRWKGRWPQKLVSLGDYTALDYHCYRNRSTTNPTNSVESSRGESHFGFHANLQSKQHGASCSTPRHSFIFCSALRIQGPEGAGAGRRKP